MLDGCVHIDFETRGSVDLKSSGVWLYAEHPETEILCVAYAVGMGQVKVSTDLTSAAARDLHSLALDPGTIFCAHNAAFEQAIWAQKMVPAGFPPLPPERWRCTMAKALRHGLPGKLELAAKFLDLSVSKDMEGNKVMQRLSKPRRITKNNSNRWWNYYDDPAAFETLYKYCKQDVVVERELDRVLMDLTDEEQELWVIDQHLNQHGILLDMEAVRAAIVLIEAHKAEKVKAFHFLTWGRPIHQDMRPWLADQGVETDNLTAPTVDDLLSQDLKPYILEALQIYQECSRTSLAKYYTMIERSDARGVVRELQQYHGAHTGRFAGRGVQFQNLARPSMNVYAVVNAIKRCGIARELVAA